MRWMKIPDYKEAKSSEGGGYVQEVALRSMTSACDLHLSGVARTSWYTQEVSRRIFGPCLAKNQAVVYVISYFSKLRLLNTVRLKSEGCRVAVTVPHSLMA